MAGLPPFGGLPQEFTNFETAAAALLPIPFDLTSTWGKGADEGPQALLEASEYLEFYDPETGTEVYRRGIATCAQVIAVDSESMIADGRAATGQILEAGKLPITLGGEHSVSQGPVEAAARHYPELSVLQLDAHSDRRDSYEGSRYNHACIISRIKETVKPPVVSVGVRSMDSSELPSVREDEVYYASEIQKSATWLEESVDLLRDDVYVTIDLDVLDPSQMPATGTPEPGGLDWYEVTGLLKTLARRKRVVGFDIVELCPDGQRHPPFLAAKLLYTFLSYIHAYQREA
ncbi:MAG: agmatinase [Candidatus Hydrogenedentota bacterium]